MKNEKAADGRIIKVTRDGIPAGEARLGSDDPTEGGSIRIFDCTTNGKELIVTG